VKLAVRYNDETRIIYLLRHGHIQDVNNVRRYIGQMDLPLSVEGERQARLLQNELSPKKITAVFCSDLRRSLDTARIIAAGLDKNIIVQPSWREISMGDWEGKSFTEIKRDFPAEYAARGNNVAGYRVPGGESFQECQARIIPAFLEFVNFSDGNIIIVGHAGVNRVLICYLLGMPLENLFRISQDYGCMNVLLYHKLDCQIQMLNVSVKNSSPGLTTF
jgi:probable phosphoglycerate mutase